MVKPMKYCDIGFTPRPGKGDHEKWTSPSGHHIAIRHQQEASPGVVKQVIAAIEKEQQS